MLPPSSPPLPRPHRRGLIEARTWCKTPCAQLALFRGLTAAASLKLDNSTVHLNAKRRLFRGLTAAASLKPSMPRTDWQPPSPLFRGLTAAASLKPRLGVLRGLPRQGSSAASPPRPH